MNMYFYSGYSLPKFCPLSCKRLDLNLNFAGEDCQGKDLTSKSWLLSEQQFLNNLFVDLKLINEVPNKEITSELATN